MKSRELNRLCRDCGRELASRTAEAILPLFDFDEVKIAANLNHGGAK